MYSVIAQLYKLINYFINIGIEQIKCEILFCNLSVFKFLDVTDILLGKLMPRGASQGVIHILRNHRGEGKGFRNDYANVIFALSNAEFDYGRGRRSRNRQKVIT